MRCLSKTKKWVAAIVVCCGVSIAFAFRQWSASDSVQSWFSIEPPIREVVEVDRGWQESSTEGLWSSMVDFEKPSPAETVEAPPTWWTSYPRTDRSVYDLFVVDPERVPGSDLLRNEVLNPADLTPMRESVEAFLEWYSVRLAGVSEARRQLNLGRLRLARDLVAKEQIPVVRQQDIESQMFRLRSGKTVAGSDLLSRVRDALGPGANDASVAMSALTMAGVFDVGDSIHMSGGKQYLIPYSRVREGLSMVLETERSMTMDLVAGVHYWFGALGALPAMDDLLDKAVTKLMEGRR